MNLEERFGELLMVGFLGQEMTEQLAAHVLNLRPSGLIFFRRNIVAPVQLARLTRDIQTLALQEFGRPLLLAVDQEGGTVARMPPPFAQIPDAAILGSRGCQAVSHYSGLTAQEMLQVGLNLNLAPVLDVDISTPEGLMRRRSFGRDPSLVAKCGTAAIVATQSESVIATAKHFPGLGRAQKDPHHDLPVVTANWEDLQNHDIIPFQSAIRANVACVMTSHTLYPTLDKELPGTFSPAILRSLLREQLGFDGVVITDDLEMGAVAQQYSPEAAALAALKAGADLLLVCNDLEKMHRTAEAVRDGLQHGLLDTDSLAASLARVESIRGKFLDPFRLSDISEVTNYFST